MDSTQTLLENKEDILPNAFYEEITLIQKLNKDITRNSHHKHKTPKSFTNIIKLNPLT